RADALAEDRIAGRLRDRGGGREQQGEKQALQRAAPVAGAGAAGAAKRAISSAGLRLTFFTVWTGPPSGGSTRPPTETRNARARPRHSGPPPARRRRPRSCRASRVRPRPVRSAASRQR